MVVVGGWLVKEEEEEEEEEEVGASAGCTTRQTKAKATSGVGRLDGRVDVRPLLFGELVEDVPKRARRQRPSLLVVVLPEYSCSLCHLDTVDGSEKLVARHGRGARGAGRGGVYRPPSGARTFTSHKSL